MLSGCMISSTDTNILRQDPSAMWIKPPSICLSRSLSALPEQLLCCVANPSQDSLLDRTQILPGSCKQALSWSLWAQGWLTALQSAVLSALYQPLWFLYMQPRVNKFLLWNQEAIAKAASHNYETS